MQTNETYKDKYTENHPQIELIKSMYCLQKALDFYSYDSDMFEEEIIKNTKLVIDNGEGTEERVSVQDYIEIKNKELLQILQSKSKKKSKKEDSSSVVETSELTNIPQMTVSENPETQQVIPPTIPEETILVPENPAEIVIPTEQTVQEPIVENQSVSANESSNIEIPLEEKEEKEEKEEEEKEEISTATGSESN